MFGFVGGCCGGEGRRVGYCSLFYGGLFGSLERVLSAVRGDVAAFAYRVALENQMSTGSLDFWKLFSMEYFSPALLVDKALFMARGGRCFGEAFAEGLESAVRGGGVLEEVLEEMGYGSRLELSRNQLRVISSLVGPLAESVLSELQGLFPDAQALLNEDFLEDLVLASRGGRRVVVVRPRVFGGLTEVLLWMLASRMAREGLVSGVFSLERFMEERARGYSLSSVDRVVLLSYDSVSREYMHSLGYVPSRGFEVWVGREEGVYSVNVFVMKRLRAWEALVRLWNSFGEYLEKFLS